MKTRRRFYRNISGGPLIFWGIRLALDATLAADGLDRKQLQAAQKLILAGRLEVIELPWQDLGQRARSYRIIPTIKRGRVEFPSTAEAIRDGLLEDPDDKV